MARQRTSERQQLFTGRTSAVKNKWLLDRREYLKLGTATAATILSTQTGVVGAEGEAEEMGSFMTDFSEYVR